MQSNETIIENAMNLVADSEEYFNVLNHDQSVDEKEIEAEFKKVKDTV